MKWSENRLNAKGRLLKTYDEDLRNDESDLVTDTVLVDKHTVGNELDDETDDLEKEAGSAEGEREEGWEKTDLHELVSVGVSHDDSSDDTEEAKRDGEDVSVVWNGAAG